MKKIILLFLLIQGLWATSYSQDTTSKQIGLDQKKFKQVLNQQFSSVLTGNLSSSVGSFASVDLKETDVSFGVSATSKKGSIFTVKGSGGITDGFSSLFTNNKFNTEISLEGQYNFLTLSKRQLIYKVEDFQIYQAKVDKITQDSTLAILESNYSFDKNFRSLNTQKEKIQSTQHSLREMKSTSDNQLIKDSISYELYKNEIVLDSINSVIDKASNKAEAEENIKNEYSKQRKALNPELPILGFKFCWVSLSYKIQNSAFKLFDRNALFSQQITDSSYISHQVKIQYSKYKYSTTAYESYYWSIGAAFSLSDNLDDLKKVDITDQQTFSNPPNERLAKKNYSSYEGNYQTKLKGIKLTGDYFKFLFHNNTAALHAFPDVHFFENTKPVYNLGLGFLYSFKDSKDEKSIVNIEAYYQFLDVFKVTDITHHFFERNNIGLKFTFPITFKNL